MIVEELPEINFDEVPTKTFTVKEIWEALQKNGLKHLRGEWISTNSQGKVIGGCVLGQTAYNLGVPSNYAVSEDAESTGNLEAALNMFRTPEKYAEWGDNIGAAIVNMNDTRKSNKQGTEFLYYKNQNPKYMFSYKKLVEMAKEMLEPYFDNTVELPHYDY